MRNRNFARVVVMALMFIGFAAGSAFAQEDFEAVAFNEPFPLATMVRKAEKIVEGTVTQITSDFQRDQLGDGESKSLYTYVTIAVERFHKGGDSGTTEEVVSFRGGMDGNDLVFCLEASPMFVTGDEVLVFIAEDPAFGKISSLVGDREGQVKFIRNSQGEEIAVRSGRMQFGPGEPVIRLGSGPRRHKKSLHKEEQSGSQDSGLTIQPFITRAALIELVTAEVEKQVSSSRPEGVRP